MQIRVLLADDHALFRSGLASLLSSHPEFTVVGEAGDGLEAVSQATALQPDVVLLDIGMPGVSGIDAAREIRRAVPHAKVLALTQHDDEGYLKRMLQAGANGYLVKKAADSDLFRAIQAVMRGEVYLHESVTRLLVQEVILRPADEAPRGEVLSEREQQVLRLLALGHTSREVAAKLAVGVKTAETYKARIAEKTGMRSRADLVRHARAAGLLDD